MSLGSLSTSNQDGLLAHVSVGHSSSRSLDDDETSILCSLAKSRPACRRRGYDGASSQEATRLSVGPPIHHDALIDEEDEHDDDDDDDENEDEDEEEEDEAEDDDDEDVVDSDEEEDEDAEVAHEPSSPVFNLVRQVPYEEITESFRHDVNQMMKYDTMVNAIAAEKQSALSAPPMNQRPTEPTGPTSATTGSTRVVDVTAVTESPFRYASTSAASRVTEKDMEKLREFVRMDRGLPLTKHVKRKIVEFRKEPAVRPKMNRATAVRTQHIRKCSQQWLSDKSLSSLEAATRFREEEMMKRLKKLVIRYKSTVDRPLFKYNRVFEMRYQSNKGHPVMPSSFRDSYETYNKPLFAVPKTLGLPKRYLWPEYSKNEVSYLGFRIEADSMPSQYQEKTVMKQKRTRKLARPPVRKTQRVVRVRPTLKTKSRKTPWNYGVFERTSTKIHYQ